jgi:hypothetical protein
MLQDIFTGIPLGIFLSFMVGPVFFVLLETSAVKGFRAALVFDLGVVLADVIFIALAYFSSYKLIQSIKNDPAIFIFGGILMLTYGITSFIKLKKVSKNVDEIAVDELIMSKFRWDNYTYLMGEHIRATEAPWYYLPKWIAISTPVFYLLAFALSLLVLPINFLKNKAAFFKEKNNLNQIMVLSFLIIPILVIIILHSTLYDSWRHVYFVYPFIIISGLYALTSLSNYLGKRAWIIVIVCALFTGFEFVKMINSHPFHYVYFNEIAGRNRNQIVQQNDFDFWGVSFKQAFEKILELDNRNDIKVTSGVSPAYYNFLFMKHNSKDTRLNYVFEEGLADYYITNYRYNPNDHAEINDKKFFSLEYANSEFITVFKLK